VRGNGGSEPKTNENNPTAKLPRRAGAQSLPEDQTEVERADVNQLPLQDIFAAPQIDSPHGSGFVAVRE
jgi:hypothetical protein